MLIRSLTRPAREELVGNQHDGPCAVHSGLTIRRALTISMPELERPFRCWTRGAGRKVIVTRLKYPKICRSSCGRVGSILNEPGSTSSRKVVDKGPHKSGQQIEQDEKPMPAMHVLAGRG